MKSLQENHENLEKYRNSLLRWAGPVVLLAVLVLLPLMLLLVLVLVVALLLIVLFRRINWPPTKDQIEIERVLEVDFRPTLLGGFSTIIKGLQASLGAASFFTG